MVLRASALPVARASMIENALSSARRWVEKTQISCSLNTPLSRLDIKLEVRSWKSMIVQTIPLALMESEQHPVLNSGARF